METALYNGKLIVASEIAESVDLELKIKIASGKGQLRCPDPNCTNPQLIYRHGEKRAVHFSHINNCNCDYATYDNDTTKQIRYVQKDLYNHFKKAGYNIQIDKKVLPNHYTHLFYEINNNKLAIEIITQKKSANNIDILQLLYDAYNINVCWIFLGNLNNNTTEKSMMFGKRYPVNRTKNNSCIVIDPESGFLEQYKLDTNTYDKAFMNDFSELYKESASLNDLIIENNSITTSEFNTHFNNWLTEKQTTYNNRIKPHKAHNHTNQTTTKVEPSPLLLNKTPQLTYEELLYNELSETDKEKYIEIKDKLYNYPNLLILFLEGSVSKSRREYLFSISKNNKSNI